MHELITKDIRDAVKQKAQVDPRETYLENNKKNIMFVGIYVNSSHSRKRRLHCIFSYNLLLS